MCEGRRRITNPLLSPPQAALLAAPFVRDIHPERKLTRALAWVKTAPEAAEVVDAAASAAPPAFNASCALCVGPDGAMVKRPGR